MIHQKWSVDQDVYEYITAFDPADCSRRLICNAATGDEQFQDVESVLEILPKDGDHISIELRKLSNQLMTAKKFGEMFTNVRACETTFKCPLSGFQYKDMMKNKNDSLNLNFI